MYVFTDAGAIETLGRTIISFARISEQIVIAAFAKELKLSAINVSRTVDAHVSFTPPAFQGSGGLQLARIKAKAAESIFGRLEYDKVRQISIRLKRECVDIKFETEKTGIVRVYRLDCIDNRQNDLELPAPKECRYTFSCSLLTFKDILIHCMPGADEAELRIDGSGQVAFYTHKLPIPRKKSGPGSTIDLNAPISKSVTTVVNVAISRFDQMAVNTPWSAKFRLKEFKVLVGTFLEKNQSLTAQFSRPSDPLFFVGSSQGCQFIFRFMTQVSTACITSQAGWLTVGTPIAVPASAFTPLLASETGSFNTEVSWTGPVSASRTSSTSTMASVSRPSLASRTSSRTSSAPISKSSRISIENQSGRVQKRVKEVGMTQKAPAAKGLFD